MKTFDICSDCLGQHHWREIDYDNVLYVSMENAICLTLCSTCSTKFLDNRQNSSSIIRYKQKINSVLEGKAKSVSESKQNNASSKWGLFF